MKVLIMLMVLAGLASAACLGATNVTLSAESTAISQVAQVLSQQSGQSVVVDTGVTANVSADLSEMDLEKALDVVTTSAALTWEKIYAPVDDKGKVDVAKVKTQLTLLKSLGDKSLVVYDPVAKKQTVFVKMEIDTTDKTAAAAQSALTFDPEKLGLKACYFIYDPNVAKAVNDKAKDPGTQTDQTSKYASLKQQQDQLFMNMSPEERKAATEQDMRAMLNMPPDQMAAMMKAQMDARRNIDPALRDQMRKVMRQSGVFGGGPGGRGGGGNRGGGNRGGGG